MPAFSIHGASRVESLILPIVGNNTTEGTPAAAVSMKGYYSAEFIVSLGTSGDTLSGSVKIDLVMQDSDDGAAWAAVTRQTFVLTGSNPRTVPPDGAGIIATIDAAGEDGNVFRAAYVGSKEYARVLVQFTGTHTAGTPISEVIVLGHIVLGPGLDS